MPNVPKKYKYAVIAVDVVIFTINKGKLHVLLIKMRKRPYERHWAAPGGLIKANESLKSAAARLLREKAGVRNVYLEQLYAFGDPHRDPFGRVVSVAYFALVPNLGMTLKTTGEYDDVNWFVVKSLPPLAYDHREIINKALRRLQSQIANSNIAYSLLPPKFTLTELQKTYEIILGRKLDKRNFRKKILSLEIVRKTRKRQSGVTNRPAELYEFASRQPRKAEIL